VIGEPDCLIGWLGLMLTLGAAAILILFQPKQPQSPTMRSYLAIAVFFCLALCTLAATHDPLTTVFTSWVQTHQKSYSNEEFLYRWNVWRENHLYILKHNSENHTFALSMNHFGDLTTEEFNRLYNGVTFDFSSHILNAQSSSNVLDEEEKFNVSAVFDWRQKGAVTQVKNQGTNFALDGDLKNEGLTPPLSGPPLPKVNAARAGLSPPLELLKAPTS